MYSFEIFTRAKPQQCKTWLDVAYVLGNLNMAN